MPVFYHPESFCAGLVEIRKGNRFPHAVGQVPGQQFIKKINRPDQPVNEQVYNGMIVMPADQHGINTQKKIKNARTASTHINWDYRALIEIWSCLAELW